MEEIKILSEKHYKQIHQVWSASVKATHTFLKPEDFDYYAGMLPTYLSYVDLYGIFRDDNLVAFMGVSSDEIEMLFVAPDFFGQKLGTCLLSFAISRLGKSLVSVNEQNTNALNFYKSRGFCVMSRDEFDSDGKPYPILHLKIK